MPARVKKQELAKLQSKVTLYNMTRDPKTGMGNAELYGDLQRYAKLILHRHRVSEQTHQVNLRTGFIQEKVKKE